MASTLVPKKSSYNKEYPTHVNYHLSFKFKGNVNFFFADKHTDRQTDKAIKYMSLIYRSRGI